MDRIPVCISFGGTSASTVDEIIPGHDFYSCEATYIDETGAAIRIPAEISEAAMEGARSLARERHGHEEKLKTTCP